jgi:hypothetical protein
MTAMSRAKLHEPRFNLVFPNRLWKAEIRWTKPRKREDVCKARTNEDAEAHFYMILGRLGSRYAIHYIGKTYRSEVWLRLQQGDHCRRLTTLKRDFPRKEWLVSHGILDLKRWKQQNGVRRYPSSRRIGELECLLIYAHYLDSLGINRRSHRAHQISDHYCITNTGEYAPLKRKIILSIFEEELY